MDTDDPHLKYLGNQAVAFQRTAQFIVLIFICASFIALGVYVYDRQDLTWDPSFQFLYVLMGALFVIGTCLISFWNFRPVNQFVVYIACYTFGVVNGFVFFFILKNLNKVVREP